MKFVSSLQAKLIYVFRINDKEHDGCLKVGEATCDDPLALTFAPDSKGLNEAAKERINHYTQTAGIPYDLLHTELTVYNDKGTLKSFNDKEVHDVLVRSGIKHKFFDTNKKANEWFYTDLETVKKAVQAVKEGRTALNAGEVTTGMSPIVFRPEQKDAIEKTIRQFSKNNSSHHMLWNAKMRFGKTLSALQVVKELDLQRTLILTHRPVVDKGWFEDFEKIFYDRPEYKYFSKKDGDSPEELKKISDDSSFSFIYFASIQDMRGSAEVGGKFNKNEGIFAIDWELVIIDEAHEGTRTELGQNVLQAVTGKDTRVLHLSGTPFNLMDEFKEDEIYTWDYVMEQKAKTDWEKIHQGDSNPYSGLPKLNIFTYNLGKLYSDYADADIAFNFKEFFRVDEIGNFIHEKDVNSFLNLMTKEDKDSNYPYSTPKYRENFRHSLWMVPGVKEAHALSTLLQKHPVFSQFEIVNVAGDGDEEVDSKDALKAVKDAITSHPENTYTITLSCGRLTTGVSVEPWTAVFMLSGSYNTTASSYMQTIFRVQTPAIINGKQKEECFVFDFAPDRTLKVIAETAKISKKAGDTTENDRQILGEFINFCPIIAVEGSKMTSYNTSHLLEQLRKVYVERVVRSGFEDGHLYNSDLLKLDEVALAEFDTLKGIIGSTKAMAKTGDININAQGLTDEEYEDFTGKKPLKEKHELTPEERELQEKITEARKNRDTAVSILRCISIRMPLMIYGAEIKDEEKEITLDNFTFLVDDQSWEEFMPKNVTKEIFEKFKKYYDKDVFCAAGKRIREMTKAADGLDIEERIGRITTIFNTFRNPDKETVLTPWRVVNMHLGDCLGGYVFYDEKFETPLETPRYVEQKDVTYNVFKRNSKILEINSKSGLYGLYCAYSIYRKRAQSELHKNATKEEQTKLWNEVLDENLYIICKTPMAKSITKRTLAGFTDAKINAHYFEDLVNQLKSKPDNFITKVTKASYWNKGENTDMKFDAIVGNPPYQVMATGDANGSDPIYHLFIEAACKIGERVSFIHPARFLFNAGKTPKDWNQKMLNDEHFKVVDYWANSSEVFPTVDIKGGVAVTYWDKIHKFDKIGTFIAYPELHKIMKKVLTKYFKTFSELVYPRDLYHLTDVLYEENPWAIERPSKGHKYDVGSNVFTVFPELFFDEKPADDEYCNGTRKMIKIVI